MLNPFFFLEYVNTAKTIKNGINPDANSYAKNKSKSFIFITSPFIIHLISFLFIFIIKYKSKKKIKQILNFS